MKHHLNILFTPEDSDDLRAKLVFWRVMAAGLGIIVGILMTTQ